MSIGTTIKNLRRGRNMTQEQLAEYMSITAPAVSQWECDRSMPDISQLPLLANIFEVSTDFLLGVDISGKEKAIEKITDDAEEYSNKDYHKKAEAVLRKGKELFPAGYNLSDELMNRIHRFLDMKDIGMAENIIDIGMKLYPSGYNLSDELMHKIRRCLNRKDIAMAETIINSVVNGRMQ